MAIPLDNFPNIPLSNYSTIRSQIRSGDILLCSGSAIFSKLIQKATCSVWSHVAFVIWLEAIDRVMVLESVESIGVRTVPLSSYIKNYNGTGKGYPGQLLLARHQQFKSADISHLSKEAVNFLGYPYDTQEILRIAARIGMKAFGLDPQDPDVIKGREFICSEYAYECFHSIGITIPYDPAGFIAPADFAKDPAIEPVFRLAT